MDNTYLTEARGLVSQMTIEEKVGLLSGADYWHTKPVERLGIESIMFSDGPHGLRKQSENLDNLGIGASEPATCFPTASLTACSFDPVLLREMGRAIGEECIANSVDVVLGPGVNIKRTPLCGRNFEYFSEDPLVAGKLAASFIRGVQSAGIGTSLKHFAVNNQEKRRMSINAVVDKRALREIYLKPFEIAIKEAHPWTIMCSYNKINGTYASENTDLLKAILKEEWRYDGAVISDWGAVHERVDGVTAGMDLEMPGSNGVNDRKVLDAIKSCQLDDRLLDEAAANVVALILKAKNEPKIPGVKNHHDLAVRVAEESIVLLRNENSVLPLQSGVSVAVLGDFAKMPRFQGAGSSKILPWKIDSPLDCMIDAGINAEFVENGQLEKCSNKDMVIVFAGLPESSESEGFDRPDMSMPEEQNLLINEVCKRNSNVLVVLMGGAPIEIPWADNVKAILLAYLGGEGVGRAVANILAGRICPSGKLAETWPLDAKEPLSCQYFPGDRLNVQYRESIFVGYRYFDTVERPVRYPFGYGLSYSTFEYNELQTDKKIYCANEEIKLSVCITNTGEYRAKETCFVFSSCEGSGAFQPKKQLIAFQKVELEPGESRTIVFSIHVNDLGFYDVNRDAFYAEGGNYEILCGSNVENIMLTKIIGVDNSCDEDGESVYYQIEKGIDVRDIPDSDFSQLLGYPIPPRARRATRPFSLENCFEDTQSTKTGRMISRVIRLAAKFVSRKEKEQEQMVCAAIMEMPFFSLVTSSAGMLSEERMCGVLEILNGRPLKGLVKLIRGH